MNIVNESISRTKSIYVVELSKHVLNEHKFVLHNPNYIKGKSCLYVGMTGLTPEERFIKHKNGIKSNVYVQKYGTRLLPNLYEKYNPMTFEEALDKEASLAEELRAQGHAVWSK